MVLHKIEDLLVKYDAAETTLQEDQELRAYFLGDDVAPHLEQYKPMFVYFTKSQQELYTKDMVLKPKRSMVVYRRIAVAAVAALMLGVVVPHWENSNTTFASLNPVEQDAYAKTMAALKLVSIGVNEGKQQLNSLSLVSDNLNHGIDTARRLSEFSKTTNRIFKNK